VLPEAVTRPPAFLPRHFPEQDIFRKEPRHGRRRGVIV